MPQLDKIKSNALNLLGIDNDWTVNDIREHLTWLTQNPTKICEGYYKEYMTEDNKIETMKWVIVNKGLVRK
jgi:hypothetical protein